MAPQHVEAKFIKINAEKSPFFVGKLQVKTLPTVVIFRDGMADDRIQGFEGLTEGMEKGKEDEFPTWKLGVALANMKVINYTKPPSMDELRKVRFLTPICRVYFCLLPLLTSPFVCLCLSLCRSSILMQEHQSEED